jgi:hypothetical protein
MGWIKHQILGDQEALFMFQKYVEMCLEISYKNMILVFPSIQGFCSLVVFYSISWCYMCSFDLVGGAPLVLLITKLLWSSFNYLYIHSCQSNNLAGWQPHDVW